VEDYNILKKDVNKKKIKIRYGELPNLWHQEQVMKGSKVHKSKKNTIPRKQKHKNIENEEDIERKL